MLLSVASSSDAPVLLDDETRAAIQEGQRRKRGVVSL